MRLRSGDESRAGSLAALVDTMIAPSEAREHLVGDGAGGCADLVDANAAADQGGEIAAPRAAVRQVGDVDCQKIHRYAADEWTAPAGDDRIGTRFAFHRAGGARIAVGVADRDDRKRSRPCRSGALE